MRTPWLIATLALLLSAPGGAAELVVNAANQTVTEVTRDGVRDIFLGRRTIWSDGSRIELVVLRGGDDHKHFLQDVIGRSPSQFTFHWRNMLFTGKGRMPTVVDSEQDLIAHVKANPQAVGYVASATDTKVEGIRSVPIQ